MTVDSTRLADQWPVILKAVDAAPRRRYNIGTLFRSVRRRYYDEANGPVLVLVASTLGEARRLMGELDDPDCWQAVNGIVSRVLGVDMRVVVELPGYESERDDRLLSYRDDLEPH